MSHELVSLGCLSESSRDPRPIGRRFEDMFESVSAWARVEPPSAFLKHLKVKTNRVRYHGLITLPSVTDRLPASKATKRSAVQLA